MGFARLLGTLVGDLTRGNVSGGLSRFTSGAQWAASSAATRATTDFFSTPPAQQAPPSQAGVPTHPPAPPPPGAGAPPPPPGAAASAPPAQASGPSDEEAWVLLQAMIASAGADGEIDADERQKIMSQAEAADLRPSEMRALEAEMDAPKSAAALAALSTGEAHGQLIYRMALSAIVVDTPEEQQFLETLAEALDLRPSIVRQIHAEVAG